MKMNHKMLLAVSAILLSASLNRAQAQTQAATPSQGVPSGVPSDAPSPAQEFATETPAISAPDSGAKNSSPERTHKKVEISKYEGGADADLADDYLSNTPSAIQNRMREDLEQKCDRLGCTIVAVHNVQKGWVFGLNVGTGQNNNNSLNNGSVLVVSPYQNGYNNDGNYVGVNVTYKNITCNSELKLEKEWFLTLKSYGAYARKTDPDTYNAPADVAKPDTKFFALVYSEMIKQLSSQNCIHQ